LFTELRPTAGLSIFQVYQYFTIYRQYFLWNLNNFHE
jgi:hypothetical protein